MKYWQLFLLFAIAAFAAVLWNLNLLSQWGLYVVAACVAGCTVVVLVNSGHLTERWMQGADLGVKVMGAVLGLIIAQWFAERDKVEQRRRDQESSAAVERSKNESKGQHDKDVAVDAEQRFAEATRTYLAALATASNAQKIYIFQSIGQALRTQSPAGIYCRWRKFY